MSFGRVGALISVLLIALLVAAAFVAVTEKRKLSGADHRFRIAYWMAAASWVPPFLDLALMLIVFTFGEIHDRRDHGAMSLAMSLWDAWCRNWVLVVLVTLLNFGLILASFVVCWKPRASPEFFALRWLLAFATWMALVAVFQNMPSL